MLFKLMTSFDLRYVNLVNLAKNNGKTRLSKDRGIYV